MDNNDDNDSNNNSQDSNDQNIDSSSTTENANDNECNSNTESDSDNYEANGNEKRPTLYIPAFFEEMTIGKDEKSSDERKEMGKELCKQDWLTTGLKREVLSHCYKREGGNATQENSRNLAAFEEACAALFPVGRIFASHTQIDQAATLFLNSWGVKKTHPGNAIKCFYSPSIHKKDRSTGDENKKRNKDPSPKALISCPFMIRYTLLGKNTKERNEGYPKVFFQVRVTSVNYSHTCNPSTITHRVAIQKSGLASPSLTGIQGIVDLIRAKPTLNANTLRPLLANHIPWFKSADAKYLNNFRRKVMKFIYSHQPNTILTNQDVSMLTDSSVSAANEPTIMDEPLARANLMELLCSVMQDSSAIWDAHRLLQEFKIQSPGLEFRTKYSDVSNKPEAIAWMLPEMKADAIRFGNILFLDMQKRNMNIPGWPYSAPCIKDNENTVRVACEMLCIAESIENYAWQLSAMQEMEPRFSLHKVEIIFADQGITPSLLTILGIEHSCLLHGDYYHLVNKVFPEIFKNRYQSVKQILELMLMGDEETWEASYQQARHLLSEDSEMVTSLDEIYANPSYYSAWKLRDMPGNLFCHGSTTAEQNHSSVVAHLGKGGNLSIAEHIHALTKRQIHLHTTRNEAENRARVARSKYRSNREGQQGMNDVEARKTLSSYAFKLYDRESRARIQMQDCPGGGKEFWSAYVPVPERRDCKRFFFWDSGYTRCPCNRRVSLSIQCRHELMVDKEFIRAKFDQRWFNDETYRNEVSNCAVVHNAPFQFPAANTAGDSSDDDNGVEMDDDLDGEFKSRILRNQNQDQNDIPLRNRKPAPTSVTYHSVLEKCTTLIRLLQHKPGMLEAFNDNLDSMLNRARCGASIKATFVDHSLSQVPQAAELPGTLGSLPNPHYVNRFYSKHEIAASHRRQAGKRMRSSNDNDHVSRQNPKTKTCSFCRGAGHSIRNCPKILVYDRPPITDQQDRTDLCSNMDKPDYFEIDQTPIPLKTNPTVNIPRNTKGIVIHAKKQLSSGQYVYELTLLGNNGDPHDLFTKYPFTTNAVKGYIMKNNSKIVVSQLVMKQANHTSQSIIFPPLPVAQHTLGGFTFSQGSTNVNYHIEEILTPAEQLAYQAHQMSQTSYMPHVDDM